MKHQGTNHDDGIFQLICVFGLFNNLSRKNERILGKNFKRKKNVSIVVNKNSDIFHPPVALPAWSDNNFWIFFLGHFSGHPWILFYTERTLKTLSSKTKSKNQVGTSSCLCALPSVPELDGTNENDGSGSCRRALYKASTSDCSSCKSEEQDESGFVDVLAVAMTNVRISEPKRSRVCSPTSPIVEQQHSSNLRANSLCRAF